MSKPGEHKTVQARILVYAQEIGWTFVSREEAEERRAGFPTRQSVEEAGRSARAPLSLFFDDLLDTQVRTFNPRYADAEGALPGKCRHLHTDIHGNREFLEHLRNRGKFFDHEEKRERDLILKRKRRLREYPDTAFRPGIPNPERLNHGGRRERKEDLDQTFPFLTGTIRGNVPDKCVKAFFGQQLRHIRS